MSFLFESADVSETIDQCCEEGGGVVGRVLCFVSEVWGRMIGL